ncbi:MAG TPA: hypothetical protein VLM79_05135, partial [Kofleriaceae bacterium]|nr:hypothetical protein [Kofleriaceae bacterium]
DDGAPPAPWQFVVTTSRGDNAIHDVFIFIAGAGELGIERGFSEFMTPASAPAAPLPVATWCA